MLQTRLLVSAVICLMFSGMPAHAEDGEPRAAQDVEFGKARALLQLGREDIIRDEIRFSEAEAAAFWPAYDAYHGDVMIVRNRQADVVIAYLKAHRDGAVSDEFAKQFIDDTLTIKTDLLQIQKKHLKQLRKALPAWKAARFFQLEDKLDAELDVQLARFIPLVDPP